MIHRDKQKQIPCQFNSNRDIDGRGVQGILIGVFSKYTLCRCVTNIEDIPKMVKNGIYTIYSRGLGTIIRTDR